MKGIVLAGGTGSRLLPLTKVTNKHLLPLGREPMIFHPVKKLTECGIRDILIVTGTEHIGAVVGLLGSGVDLGCELTYRVQDRPGGIAEALGLARNFAHGDRMVVILGDNVFEASLTPYVERFTQQRRGARLLLKEVTEPERFGVAELRDGKIVSIVEKPKEPRSRFCVTGIYMFDERVFGFIDRLKPSGRGELEITDVNNAYIADDSCEADLMDGWWSDAGTFESYEAANRFAWAALEGGGH